MNLPRWTHERTEAVRKLWLDGLSARQIADVLGGVTRNAVIGKLNRLGLTGRSGTRQPPSQPRRCFAAPKPPKPAPAFSYSPAKHRSRRGVSLDPLPTSPPSLAPVPVAAVYLMALKPSHCRWPVDGPDDSTMFCGQPKAEGSSYCAQHKRLNARPQQSSAKAFAHGLKRAIG